MGGSRWVGGKSFKNNIKKNWVEDKEKIKFQKKELKLGLSKGKAKKSTWNDTWIEKRILLMHHPSTLVHWWVQVHFGHNFKLWIHEFNFYISQFILPK